MSQDRGTVTVTKKGKGFISEFSKLPGQQFGPWDFSEMSRDLRISALLSPRAARDLVLEAAEKGAVTVPVG